MSVMIPDWLVGYTRILNFGGVWPAADEDKVRELGQLLIELGEQLDTLHSELSTVRLQLEADYRGDGGDAIAETVAALATEADRLADTARTIGHSARRAGADFEYTKLMMLTFAALTAWQLAVAVATLGGTLAELWVVAAGRIAVKVAGESLIDQLAADAAQVDVRGIVSLFARQFTVKQMLAGAVRDGLLMGRVDAAIEGGQVLVGERDVRDVDTGRIAGSVVSGIGSGICDPVGGGARAVLGRAGVPGWLGQLIGASTGNAVSAGGYWAGGVAGQLVGQLVDSGNINWPAVDPTFEPRLLLRGVSLGVAQAGVAVFRDATVPNARPVREDQIVR
ncbi:WXG100-like domain-containing protein [Nocardia sp. CDC160]|uniref:WXG100-like domain-containing protein n=1 Tax=Nocardia sp. CDC160 TaxID=3112166 RepID=UPI002DB90A85|nr:hypothetical protein [Nocardia sp. CDC160]MEC3919280.1 hypothetical protein [Nocardia sp. CDC160]